MVADAEILDAMERLAIRHGISASPEGAAPYAALRHLAQSREIRPGETVLLYNTGTGIPFSLNRLREETVSRGTPSLNPK
jgi:threonine synthase